MDEYRDQFKKEKKRTYWAEGCDYGSFNDEYVDWLEQQLKNCNLQNVSNRRELLLEYEEWINDYPTKKEREQQVDKFLNKQ